jgi:hypothetical protein
MPKVTVDRLKDSTAIIGADRLKISDGGRHIVDPEGIAHAASLEQLSSYDATL